MAMNPTDQELRDGIYKAVDILMSDDAEWLRGYAGYADIPDDISRRLSQIAAKLDAIADLSAPQGEGAVPFKVGDRLIREDKVQRIISVGGVEEAPQGEPFKVGDWVRRKVDAVDGWEYGNKPVQITDVDGETHVSFFGRAVYWMVSSFERCPAPQGDSKPVAQSAACPECESNTWRVYEECTNCGHETELAHPPSDSIEQCIKELPEGCWLDNLTNASRTWVCVIGSFGKRFEGNGPTLLSALRAAIERIPMKEEG